MQTGVISKWVPSFEIPNLKSLAHCRSLNSKPELCRTQLFCLCDCPALARLSDSAFNSFPNPLGSRKKSFDFLPPGSAGYCTQMLLNALLEEEAVCNIQ